MGVRIIESNRDELACIYNSVSDVAFGPVFYTLTSDEAGEHVYAGEQAEGFLAWLEKDARTYTPSELAEEYSSFRKEIEERGWKAVAEEVKT